MWHQKSATSIPFDEHAAEMIARVVGTELGELRRIWWSRWPRSVPDWGGLSFNLTALGRDVETRHAYRRQRADYAPRELVHVRH